MPRPATSSETTVRLSRLLRLPFDCLQRGRRRSAPQTTQSPLFSHYLDAIGSRAPPAKKARTEPLVQHTASRVHLHAPVDIHVGSELLRHLEKPAEVGTNAARRSNAQCSAKLPAQRRHLASRLRCRLIDADTYVQRSSAWSGNRIDGFSGPKKWAIREEWIEIVGRSVGSTAMKSTCETPTCVGGASRFPTLDATWL